MKINHYRQILPIVVKEFKKFVANSRERYAKAGEFVLAGGGAVGVGKPRSDSRRFTPV
jgi:hypothetical protein